MGQVIAFPAKREPKAEERRAALVTGLCAVTYLLGFFLLGPSLAIYAFGFATTAHPLSAVACVAGLGVVWVLTRVAYKRL
jgi:hypothetical protein